MAATGTPTPNIGLRIPKGTDPASVDDINYNSNLLDTKLGAVGSTSVQDQIDSLNRKIRPSENPIGYTLKSGFSLESWGQINVRVVGGLLLISIGGLTTNHDINADEEFLSFNNFTITNMGSSYGIVWVSSRDKPGNISAFSGKVYLNRIPANATIIGQIAIPIYV